MTFYCFAYWKASLSSTILIIKGIYLSCKSWGQNSYIPWMSQHSCTYFCIVFVFFFFISLFIRSQNSAVLRGFLRLPGRNLCRNHPSHAAHPEQLQAHLAGQSRTSRWESCFLFATLPARTLVCQSLKVMLSWMNFPNEQTLLRKRRKGGKKMQRIRMFNQLWHSFVNRICYLRSFMTSRCFINKPEVAFSQNLLIRSLFQSHRVSIVPAGCSFVVILHTRSALVSAFLIHVYCFGNWLLI